MAICIFTIRTHFYYSRSVTDRKGAKQPGHITPRIVERQTNYILRCDSERPSELKHIVNTIFNAHSLFQDAKSIFAVEIREIEEGQRLSMASKFQTYKCFGRNPSYRNIEEQKGILDYQERVTWSNKLDSPYRNSTFPDRAYQHGDRLEVFWEKRNCGMYPTNKTWLYNNTALTEAVRGISKTHFDPFVGAVFVQQRKSGIASKHAIYGASYSMFYLGQNGRIKAKESPLRKTSAWEEYRKAISHLTPYFTNFYLDSNEVLRSGYDARRVPIFDHFSDFHAQRKAENSKSDDAVSFKNKAIMIESAYHVAMNVVEILSQRDVCNECGHLVNSYYCKPVLRMIRLMKWLLITHFVDRSFSYSQLGDDLKTLSLLSAGYQGCDEYGVLRGLPVGVVDVLPQFVKLPQTLLKCDDEHLRASVYTLNSFEESFANFIEIRTKHPIKLGGNAPIEVPGRTRIPDIIEFTMYSDGNRPFDMIGYFYYSYNPGSGVWINRTDLPVGGPGSIIIDGEGCYRVENWQHKWIRETYNTKAANERQRLFEACLRVSGVFSYIARYIDANDNGTKREKVFCLSASEVCAATIAGTFNTGTGQVDKNKIPRSWSEQNRARDASRNGPGVQAQPGMYVCAPLDYDRRDVLSFEMDYKNRYEKKRKQDRQRRKTRRRGDCEPEELVPQTSSRIPDRTRHVEAREETQAEKEARLERYEEALKKGGSLAYDVAALGMAPTPAGTAMAITTPENHLIIRQAAGQINPCDNDEDLVEDIDLYVKERLEPGNNIPFGGIKAPNGGLLKASRGFVKGGTKVGAVLPKQTFHALAEADEAGVLINGIQASRAAAGKAATFSDDFLQLNGRRPTNDEINAFMSQIDNGLATFL